MAQDSNRGRDLPRGPKHIKPKVVRSESSEDNQRKIARAERVAKLKKALAALEISHGNGVLFPMVSVDPNKLKEKRRKIVLSALAHDLPVHPKLLAEFGLEATPNPKVPDGEDDGKAPF